MKSKHCVISVCLDPRKLKCNMVGTLLTDDTLQRNVFEMWLLKSSQKFVHTVYFYLKLYVHILVKKNIKD